MYFKSNIGRFIAAAGKEEARPASVCMRANRFNVEVEHFKVQLEISKNYIVQLMEALSELEKIHRVDPGARSFLQVSTGNEEQILNPTAQVF